MTLNRHPANSSNILNFPTVIELADETLGKLLAPTWTVATVRKAVKLWEQHLADTEYAIILFSEILRPVAADVAPTSESYRGAPPIGRQLLEELSEASLDSLAWQYLEKADAWKGTKIQFAELNGTQVLQCLVSSKAHAQTTFAGVLSNRTKSSDALTNTDCLDRELTKALRGVSIRGEPLTPAVEIKRNLSALPQDPAVETNRELAPLATQVSHRVEIAQREVESTQAFREASDLAVESAAQSSAEAARATKVARTSLIIALTAMVIAVGAAILQHRG